MKPGERLHKYTILGELGRGGMGGVYHAEEDGTGVQVAIKTLFKRFANEEAYVRRFQREAQVYRQLDHPNIIHYIESGFDAGTYFIVLEYIRGKTLGEIMYDQGRLDAIPALKVAIGLAEALQHAHDRGIVHRDLKPANIIIGETGEVRLLDFGVAHKEDQLVRTQEGTVVGTYFYAAPEQNQGKKDIDNRTDIYTLGIVLYEMLTGRRPFEGDLLEVASEQARESYTPVEELVPEVPPFLPQVVQRLMARKPPDRYQSCNALLEELRAALTALTTKGMIAPELGRHPSAQPVEMGIEEVSMPPDLASVPGRSLSISSVFPVVSAASPGSIVSPGTVTPPPAVAPFGKISPVSPPTRSADLPVGTVTMPMQVAPVIPTVPTPSPSPTPTPSSVPGPPSASGIGQGVADTRWHAAKEAFQARRLDKAQELAEAVVISAPQFAPGFALLGKIHAAKGFTYNAIEAFKMALSLTPNDVHMHMDHAMALYTMKLPQKAMEAFGMVLQLDPGNMLAERYIQLLQASDGDVSAPEISRNVVDALDTYTGSSNPLVSEDPHSDAHMAMVSDHASLYGDVYVPPGNPPPPVPESVIRADSVSPPQQRGGASPPVVSMVPPGVSAPVQDHLAVSSFPVSIPDSMAPSPYGAPKASPVSPVSLPPSVHMPGAPPVAPPVAPSIPPPAPMQVSPPVSVVSVPPPKRTPEYIPPPKPLTGEEESPGQEPVHRFAEKRTRKRRERHATDGIILDTDRAWNLGSMWWGLGAGYVGLRLQAFVYTVLEVVILGMVLLPWNSGIDLSIRKATFSLDVADLLARTGVFDRGGALVAQVDQLQVLWRPKIQEFLLDMGPEAVIAMGVLLFFWFEASLPNRFYKKAQFANLSGTIQEVRRDMTIKISLGTMRGVVPGMIFRVEKRKHVDKLSGGDFRTMVMAPQVFAIGEAKVIRAEKDHAICKFRRIQGQSSSPSVKDRVVILRRS
jgi:serine/threonine protein kinase